MHKHSTGSKKLKLFLWPSMWKCLWKHFNNIIAAVTENHILYWSWKQNPVHSTSERTVWLLSINFLNFRWSTSNPKQSYTLINSLKSVLLNSNNWGGLGGKKTMKGLLFPIQVEGEGAGLPERLPGSCPLALCRSRATGSHSNSSFSLLDAHSSNGQSSPACQWHVFFSGPSSIKVVHFGS